jgi:hypothetical protein
MILMLPAVYFCNLKSLIVVLQSILKSNAPLANFSKKTISLFGGIAVNIQ